MSIQLILLVAAFQEPHNPDAQLKWGTLMDMHRMSLDPDNTHSVNALDFPMGEVSVRVPSHYRYIYNKPSESLADLKICRHFATHEHAIQATRGLKGLPLLNPYTDDTIWGTAALKHLVSWQHIDDEGFGTAVMNVVGCKYWVLGRCRRDASHTNRQGDMGSVEAFGPEIRPQSVSSDIYEHEAVLLTPGTVL